VPIKDIVIQVCDPDTCAALVPSAARLAVAHGARLIGLCIEPPLLTFIGEAPPPLEVIARWEEEIRARTARLEAHFVDTARRLNAEVEWRLSTADARTAMNVNARYADLVALAHAPDATVAEHEMVPVAPVVFEAGRPVLVIPRSAAPGEVGRRILVAWNGRREAVRAVHDALPLLARADFVQVVTVNPRVGYGEHGEVPGADICRHLARHGAPAESHALHAEGHAQGAALLEQATAIGADLIVMGIYGHSRLREWVLGGVSQHMLKHAAVPLLMAH
jgi:nucleotide-binding universal stress UspA family protein